MLEISVLSSEQLKLLSDINCNKHQLPVIKMNAYCENNYFHSIYLHFSEKHRVFWVSSLFTLAVSPTYEIFNAFCMNKNFRSADTATNTRYVDGGKF